MNKKLFLVLMILFTIIQISPNTVFAASPYENYNYNYWGEPLPGPQAYLPSTILDGEALGLDKFTSLGDIFISIDKNIFIVDSGANRIICLDKEWKVVRIIETFENNNNTDTFNNPNGIFVTDDGNIYVADTDNERIVELDSNGKFKREILRPESDIINAELPYKPIKLVLDKALRIYVVSKNWNQGIIELGSDGLFRGFIGANRVTPNPIEYLWRMIATKEQKKRSVLFKPTEYNNIYMDRDGFIFATTSTLAEADIQNVINNRITDDKVAPIRKLNSTGTDVLRRYGFHPPVGDITFAGRGSITGPSMFMDVTVDISGVYSVLDGKRGRIFTYDSDGNLLYVFGALGNQNGTFSNPIAIEYMDDQMVVLDSGLNTINIFGITDYGRMVKDAVMLHFLGKYEESAVKWEEVLKYNANLDLAYIGLGKSLLRQNKFDEAMKNFKLGSKRDYYSKAFRLYRKEVVGQRFGYIMAIAALVIIIFVVLSRRRKKFGKSEVEA